ncbi:protein TolQ [Alkanindiges hydrocarboniclasticus]|jgi:biopolymer transport protein TolQ|uniref:Tol-Pal system protein TolQ n=1 Tax=Alkanindiges hydrocarboniclasticus TaxID=1907941 RepID=A0A1S8CWD6_9GAMM|nr:protein TolQ [Alkanindiges hydrocarboniclasticus]ONG41647.1 protein TolQ [Alkanindiges hydrocarboniclasticus]
MPTTATPTSLNISDLILHASPVVQIVMLILFLASIYGWFLIAKLEMTFRKSNQQDSSFEKIFWSGADLKTLYKNAQTHPHRQGIESVFYEGFTEFLKLKKRQASREDTISGTERMLRVSLSREQNVLEQGASTLASIGSVSPYVGLFGTVWGIMNAFIGLAQVEQVTLATVAPGIAEALIATAIGLFAAIPAVLAYNRYSAKSEAVYQQRALFAEEMTALLQRESLDGTGTGSQASNQMAGSLREDA